MSNGFWPVAERSESERGLGSLVEYSPGQSKGGGGKRHPYRQCWQGGEGGGRKSASSRSFMESARVAPRYEFKVLIHRIILAQRAPSRTHPFRGTGARLITRASASSQACQIIRKRMPSAHLTPHRTPAPRRGSGKQWVSARRRAKRIQEGPRVTSRVHPNAGPDSQVTCT